MPDLGKEYTMPLTKEQILAASPKLKEVEVPEWGGSVFIRPVTLEEQGKPPIWEPSMRSLRRQFGSGIALFRCFSGLCATMGKALFSAEDLAGLMSKSSASAFLRLQDAVLKFSCLLKNLVEN